MVGHKDRQPPMSQRGGALKHPEFGPASCGFPGCGIFQGVAKLNWQRDGTAEALRSCDGSSAWTSACDTVSTVGTVIITAKTVSCVPAIPTAVVAA